MYPVALTERTLQLHQFAGCPVSEPAGKLDKPAVVAPHGNVTAGLRYRTADADEKRRLFDPSGANRGCSRVISCSPRSAGNWRR